MLYVPIPEERRSDITAKLGECREAIFLQGGKTDERKKRNFCD
jgi:hypothetical protein